MLSVTEKDVDAIAENGLTADMTNELNELAGIKTYTVTELRAVAADDRHAVRDEAIRRHNLAAKKLANLQKQVAELETLVKEVM